ncbi:MAG: DUF4214 domain-containing protein, partial [Marinobacterium sp.]|nr:DUF4214 domain-containing protein [Marinobacterium sp.]
MATNKDLVTGLYVAIYDRAPDQAGRDGWLSALDAGTYNATTMAAEFIKAAPTKFSELYDGKTNEQIVQAAYNNILGRNGEDAGVANWTAFLDANGQDAFFASFVTSALDYDPAADTTSDAATKAAATTAQQALSNKVEAGNYFADTLGTKSNGAIDSDIYNQSVSLLNGVTEDAATLAAARATVDQLNTDTPDPGVDGAKFYLTSGTDEASDFAFSDNNDTFLAYLQQNSLVGGVSNSLSSADRLDGGAGSDSLYAELVTEFYGVNGNNAIDVQARTSSIENVTFQARDMSAGGGSVTVDAKHMTDIVKIGSVQSDGDLVIENLTTLTSAGALRNTESITVTMDHTDNFNSDGDASDLTVYFDEDYLLAGRIEDSNTVQYEVMNQDAWDLINLSGRDDVQLLDGVVFQHLSFVLNGSTVDLTSALNENGDDLAIRTHQDLADAINTALTGLGLDNQVNAVVGPNFTERTAVQTGDERSAPTVQLVGQPGVELSATEDNAFLAPVSEAEREIPASNRYDRAAVSTNDGRDEDVTVNVELHKVGREGEGGNLMIGGKSNDAAEGNGVQVFNISVLGDATKPSNLGQITSTNGALQTINIVTDAAFVNGDTHASLTVRGEDMQSTSNVTDTDAAPFGGNVAKVDASGFLGNLSLGNETRVDNLGELVATGGGDVSYWAVSTDTITTGNGNDYINEVNSGASITSGAGNDQIVADADANMTINAGTGDDTVDLLSEETGAAADVGADAVADQNTVTVDLGAGNDTLMDNNEHVVVNSGAGNDALYLENTGTKGVAANVNLAQDFGTSDAFADNVEDGYQLLLGRTVTVTFNGDQGVNNGNVEAYTDGFEATATVQAGELTDVAGNSYSSLTSKADLGNAIESAVNNSDVLSKLVSFDKATFTFTSLVDGSDNQVEVRIGDTNWSAATQDAIETEYQRYVDDSDATVNNSYVGYAVDSALAGGADSTDSSDNTVVIAAGMDVAQLSTDSTSTDTIQFTTQDFGTTYINNFDGNDVLDFSAFLNDQNSSSGSADSAELIAITAGNDLNVAANEVTNLNFSPVANVPTWNDLTEANLLEAFNLTNSTYSNQQLFGGTGHSVVMVENNANAGEYKVFYVTFDGTTANSVTASSIDYKGTVDFGASGAAIESGVALAN